MRLSYIALLSSLVMVLGACAGTPPAPVRTASATPAAPAAAAPTAAAPSEASGERKVKVDANNIVEVQKAGYKIVNEDGKTLYCRRDLNTGSHLRKTTTCLTQAELNEALERSQQGVEDMARHRLPPHQGP